MVLNYTAGVTMAFRREVDHAVGLGPFDLLQEIARRPQVLSRRRHYKHWPLRSSGDELLRLEVFEAIPFVSPSSNQMDDHIDAAAGREDIRTIRSETNVVHDYVEQMIAHRSRGEPTAITFEEFNAAVDALTPFFKRYYTRLTNSALMEMTPIAQYNTHLPFTFPWDVTCDRMWTECRGERELPWQQIHDEYRDDPTWDDG